MIIATSSIEAAHVLNNLGSASAELDLKVKALRVELDEIERSVLLVPDYGPRYTDVLLLAARVNALLLAGQAVATPEELRAARASREGRVGPLSVFFTVSE